MPQLSRSSLWRSLPLKPGVYIFKDPPGQVLYVGKAKNLKNRVRSYFQPLERLGPKTSRLVGLINSVEIIEVGSEIEALLLESRLIKRFRPPYNIAGLDDKSPYYIHLTREQYPRPVINHESLNALVGPFLNSRIPRSILRSFRSVAPYCIAPRPVRRPCFYSHLGLCTPCPGNKNMSATQYRRNIGYLRRLLNGNFSSVEKSLSAHMNDASRFYDFESAARLRDRLAALSYLRQMPVSPDDYLINPNLTADKRQSALDALKSALSVNELRTIEMYDVAHLSGVSATAAMTVAVDGETDPRRYRHFTIKSPRTDSDVDMMREVLIRRLRRSDWPLPDLIVLDGGKPQLSILKSQISDFNIPIIALAKRDEILVFPTADGFRELKLDKSDPGLLLLVRLRDEAHRFSRRLHHKHRSKSLTNSSS